MTPPRQTIDYLQRHHHRPGLYEFWRSLGLADDHTAELNFVNRAQLEGAVVAAPVPWRLAAKCSQLWLADWIDESPTGFRGASCYEIREKPLLWSSPPQVDIVITARPRPLGCLLRCLGLAGKKTRFLRSIRHRSYLAGKVVAGSFLPFHLLAYCQSYIDVEFLGRYTNEDSASKAWKLFAGAKRYSILESHYQST